MTTQQHLATLTKLGEQLAPWQPKFDQIKDILVLKKQLSEKIARFSAEEQHLSIAIMGQVKAGKSSLLNKLLFNGHAVLPEAATPKTANLTRISWGETPRLEVEYYHPDEWKKIETTAKEGDHQEARVARELMQMAKASGIKDVNAILQQKTTIVEAKSVDGLLGKLNDYTGNNGRYTSLVKMTRLYLPMEELKGFDIVDTPGMNDPVISRTEKTKEEMARCDVAFFLSRCSQFLDQSDMDLLARQLPSKGVKHMVLVAAQFDSAIWDDGYQRSSLEATESNVKTRLTKRAVIEMNKLADQRQQDGRIKDAQLLRSLTKPIFASTFAHSLATEPSAKWNSGLKHAFDQLSEMAGSEWSGYKFSQQDWLRIGNFEELNNAYQRARDDKRALLKAQKEGLLPEAQQQLQDALQHLKEAVNNRIQFMQQGDIAKLVKQQQAFEKRIKSLSNRLGSVVVAQLETVKVTHRDVLQQLRKSMQSSAQIQSRTGSYTEERSYTVDTSVWYNPFSWGDTETRTRTRVKTYEYLMATDAIEQINDYAQECVHAIELRFNNLLNTAQLRANLRRELIDELTSNSMDFDPAQFREVLDSHLRTMDIPQLHLSCDFSTDEISRYFQGKIEGSDIHALQEKVSEALKNIFNQLTSRFDSAIKSLSTKLTLIQNNLEKQLTERVRADLEVVRQDFANKEKVLVEYQNLLGVIKPYL